LDVVDPWDKTMEPDWFAKPTPPRTSGFSCSRAKPPLLTQMHCRNTSGMPAQLPARPPCLVAFLVRCSCFAPVSLALNLLVRGLLPCMRTHLRNRAEPATGKTLPLAITNAPIQFCSDLRVLQLRRPFHLLPAVTPSATTAAGLVLRVESVPRYSCPRLHARSTASCRCRCRPFITSSSRCRLTSFTAFFSTVSDVLHARLYCPLGGSASNRRAAASPHPRARLHAAADPELRSSARVASHVPQLLHTGATLFPCRSTPSRQYCAAPPPAFARLRAIGCRGLALAPHAPCAPCQLTPSAPLARAAAPHLHSHARAAASPASLTRTSRAVRARLEPRRPAPAPWLRPASLLPCCALAPAEPRAHQRRRLCPSAVRRSGHQRHLEQLPLARRAALLRRLCARRAACAPAPGRPRSARLRPSLDVLC
jgi:hypothetical protein